MRVEHIAIWTLDMERLASFYEKYFNAKRNDKYRNDKGFESYFLVFDEGARLEIMKKPSIDTTLHVECIGYAHVAFSVGNRENVISLTRRIENDGYKVVSKPRTTGDGYFESVILDPDGNIVEITP